MPQKQLFERNPYYKYVANLRTQKKLEYQQTQRRYENLWKLNWHNLENNKHQFLKPLNSLLLPNQMIQALSNH